MGEIIKEIMIYGTAISLFILTIWLKMEIIDLKAELKEIKKKSEVKQ